MAESVSQFGGHEVFAAEPARVYTVLTDLDTLAASIPDLVSAERIDSTSMRCVVRPGFAFLRGEMKLLIALADLNPPESATMTISAQGIGVGLKVESRLQIVAEGQGSKLTWQASVTELKGLIATVSPGLVKAAANSIIRDAWKKAHERLDAQG